MGKDWMSSGNKGDQLCNAVYVIQEEQVGEEEAFFANVLCMKGVDKNDISTRIKLFLRFNTKNINNDLELAICIIPSRLFD